MAQVVEYKLVKADGGSKDNAICKKTDAEIVIAAADVDKLKTEIKKAEDILAHELKAVDPDIKVSVELGEEQEVSVLDDKSKTKIITWLINSPESRPPRAARRFRGGRRAERRPTAEVRGRAH